MAMVFNSDIWQITLLSLQVSSSATAISLLIGLPVGTWLALGNLRARSFILSIINTGMALPPVVVGLVVHDVMAFRPPRRLQFDLHACSDHYCANDYRRSGCHRTDRRRAPSARPRLRQQLLGLGAVQYTDDLDVVARARLPLLAALMAGFGSVISEVGASMMVGGNIQGQTRVLTTAIVLETDKGEFNVALGLSALLLVITYLITLA